MPDAENDMNILKRKEMRLMAELSRVRNKMKTLESGDETGVSQPEEPCADCPGAEPVVEEIKDESPRKEKKSKKKKDKED